MFCPSDITLETLYLLSRHFEEDIFANWAHLNNFLHKIIVNNTKVCGEIDGKWSLVMNIEIIFTYLFHNINSSSIFICQASELGMLQHRLHAEEETTKTLRRDLNAKDDEIKELLTQLDAYESLVKTNHNQLSSTPFVPSSGKNMRRGLLDFKTPISQ